jgi:glycosyltransferase involved in cell wall biosynthesis
MSKKVTIIIPAYNEENDIKDVLDSIMKQTYPKEMLETIVIDDKSTDRTPEIVSQYPVKMIKGKHKGVGAARNLGIKNASGDIILFVDADQILDKNYVKEIVKPFKDEKVGGVTGMEYLWNKNSLIAKLSYLKKRLGYETAELLPLGAVRKNVIKEIGFINSSFGMYDDWEFAKRVSKKYKIVRIKSAKFYHKEPDKIQKIYRQCKWTAKSTIFLFVKKEYFKFLRNCGFIFLNALLPVYILFLFLPLFFKIIGVFGILVFSILEFYRSFKMYKITKWLESFITPIYDSFYMLLVVLGFLEIIIKNELNFGV